VRRLLIIIVIAAILLTIAEMVLPFKEIAHADVLSVERGVKHSYVSCVNIVKQDGVLRYTYFVVPLDSVMSYDGKQIEFTPYEEYLVMTTLSLEDL
jgi:hypothetical protein